MKTARRYNFPYSWRLVVWLVWGALAILVLWACLLARAAEAGTDPVALDVVLVLDSSGSMKKTDPRDLRKEAAKLFVSLLSPKDRVSVVGFSDTAEVLTEWRATGSDSDKKNILAAIGAVMSLGKQTDIYDGAEAALRIIEKEPSAGQDRVVILMTDGKVDTGVPEKDRETTRRLIEELPARYKAAGAALHTMAFTKDSDVGLLEKVAFRSGGFMAVAETSDELHEAFLQFFGKLKKPESTPVVGNEFLLDESVSEATLVAKKEASDVEVALIAPDGRKIDRYGEGTGFERFTTTSYDMITIRRPRPGRWRIRFSHGDGNRVVLITDLKLSCSFDQSFLSRGMVVPVEVFLSKGDELVNDPAVLTGVDASMSLFGPDTEDEATLALKDDGTAPDAVPGDAIFTGEFGPLKPGSYRLAVHFRGRTFSRSKEIAFRVNQWWYESTVSYSIEDGQPFVRAALSSTLENASFDRIAMAGEIELKGTSAELQFAWASGGFRARLDQRLGPGEYAISLRIRQEFGGGVGYWIHLPKQTLFLAEEDLEKLQEAAGVQEEGFWSGWIGAGFLLLVFNGLLVAPIYGWRKRDHLMAALKKGKKNGKKGGES